MSQRRGPRGPWPLLVAFLAVLAGAIALEVMGRASEASGEVIVIAGGGDVDVEGDGPTSEAAEELREPRSPEHAEARRLAQRGHVDEAITITRTVADGAPDDAAIWAELGYLLLTTHGNVEAARVLERSLELDPERPWVALNAGVAHGRLGNAEAAEARYRDAIRLRPSYSEALVSLGRLLRIQGRRDEAIELLEPASERGSNDRRARALSELGRSLLEEGRRAEAEAAFDGAIERAPADASVRLAIGRAWLTDDSEDHLERAVEVLSRAILVAPTIPQLYGALGTAQEARGETAEARQSFLRGIQLDPAYAYGQRRLIRLLLDLGEVDQAAEQVVQMLAHDDETPENHFLAGLVAARADEPEQAMAHYRAAIERAGGTYPEALLNLGNLQRDLGRTEEALESYREALEQRPGYPAALNNLGLALWRAGREEEAVAEYEALLDAQPSYGSGWYNLGKLYGDLERHDEAAAAFRATLAVEPTNRAALLSLGVALRKGGRSAEAVDVYGTLTGQQPRYVAAWYNRGIALEEVGRDEDARASYQAALQLDAGHANTLSRLARLQRRLGELEAAEATATELLEREPGSAKILRLRARIRRDRGAAVGCQEDAGLAIAQDPEDHRAQKVLPTCGTATPSTAQLPLEEP